MSAVIQRSHLDWLESEAIFIMREVAAESEKPVLLFSGGKDSVAVSYTHLTLPTILLV